jgi:pilus assembly protein CpaF
MTEDTRYEADWAPPRLNGQRLNLAVAPPIADEYDDYDLPAAGYEAPPARFEALPSHGQQAYPAGQNGYPHAGPAYRDDYSHDYSPDGYGSDRYGPDDSGPDDFAHQSHGHHETREHPPEPPNALDRTGEIPRQSAPWIMPRPLERQDDVPVAGDRLAPQVFAGPDAPRNGWPTPATRPGYADLINGGPVAPHREAARTPIRVDAYRTDGYPMLVTPALTSGPPHEQFQTRAEPAIQIDYELVTILQAEVSRLVIDTLRGETTVDNEHRRRITRELAEVVVRRNVDMRLRSGETGPVTWPGYEAALGNAVTAYLIGLGRLQPLIDDPDVENIMVLGTRVRVVFANGIIDDTSYTSAASDEELIALLQRLAERGGQTERSLSSAKPILHLRLPDGARLTVIYMVTSRPVVVIRRHRIKDVSLANMVDMDAITPTLKSFLEAAVRAHMNIMIAGRANSGKTTLLRAIADEIPREEWFCVLETVGELGLDSTGRHPWAVCFEEREGFGEKGVEGRPEGQLTIDDLFPHMLRLSANRIIVGEVRAEEIVAMFDAMNTTYGSLCTIHSRDEHGVFDRLAELLLRYGASKSREGAYLTIGNALDLVVYINMDEYPGRRPRRYVSSVMEVHGLGEGRQLSRSRLFAPGPTGLAVPTNVRPSERRAWELQNAGFDMRLLLSPGAFFPDAQR